MKKTLLAAIAFLLFISCNRKENVDIQLLPEEDASQFVSITDVVPDAILEIRYFSSYNFIGERIPGYEQPIAMLTRQAADSLKAVSDDLLQKGYRLKIFDAYRPQCAVDFFMEWAADTTDVRMQDYFYPELDKSVLIPQGYIAEKSGHTRGSTIDLTLFDMKTEREVDMGGLHIRLFRRGIASRCATRAGNRCLSSYQSGAIRQPHDFARGHARTRIQALRLRMVAFHP